jgi:hypothetical protein
VAPISRLQQRAFVNEINHSGALARKTLVLGLGFYGILCLRAPHEFGIVDAVNLAIHETGHLVFTPFGEFMHFLGGTLFQLIFPLLFVAYFARQGDRFAAWVTCWWVAQNLWNISVYVADARALELPLVGGGEHDWAYLLGRLGMLQHDVGLSRAVHFAGVALFGWAMLRAWSAAGDPERSADVSQGNRAPGVRGIPGVAAGASHPEASAAEAGRAPAMRSHQHRDL